MSGIIPIDGFGGGGVGGGGASIAKDMFFSSISERDTFTTNNPSRIYQGVACAVGSGPSYDYYQWDDVGSQWRDANLIYQGGRGDPGTPGEKGDTVKITSVDNELDADGKLKTTVALDDGTSAESTPLQLPAGSEINIDGEAVSTIYTEGSIDTLIEDGAATLSVNNKVSLWPINEVGIGDSPFVIDKHEQLGIEYQYEASDQLTQAMHLYQSGLPEGAQVKVTVVNVSEKSKPIDVFQLGSGGGLRWPVSTPTVFTLRGGVWRVEESSQMLHVTGATTYAGEGADKTVIHGIAVDPSSDLTAAVSEDGLLVLGRTYTPPTDTIDIAFWWSDNKEPTADDILNAMSQTQTVDVISHTDDFYRDDLQKRTMTAKRDESSFKYLFFAWHKGFFNPEPTKVDTGWGAPSTWLETEISASGVLYKVLTVEVKNNSALADDYALVQEGVR